MKSDIALVRCLDYSSSSVERAVRQALNLLGGIDKFIRPGSRVLLKPNLLMARGPESAIVTHPEVVRAVIRLLKDVNAKIYVGDSPSAWQAERGRIQLVWEKSGIERVTQEEGVELVRFAQSRWYEEFPLTTWLDKVDYLISLPKFKTHDLTILTGAVKNLFGLIPGRYKVELHKRYFTPLAFSGMLLRLYEITRPALTIVDGILAMEGEGPGSSGLRRSMGLIIAGRDCVSIDSVLSMIMGLRPEDIPTNLQARRKGLGVVKIEDIQIRGEALDEFKGKPFRLPVTTFKYKLPRPLIQLLRRLIYFYPIIDSERCGRCFACSQICPQSAISFHKEKAIIDHFRCISCFCCQEVCPNGAIRIRKSLVSRLLRL